MLIAEGNMIMYSKYFTGKFFPSSFLITILIDGKAYYTRVCTNDNSRFNFDVYNKVKAEIMFGELAVINLYSGIYLDAISGKSTIGRIHISDIKEIYVEKEAIESVNDIVLRRKIVSYAERLDNAIIFEQVYDLI